MAHTGVTEADQPYWDNLRAGRLTMQKCEACNNWQWPAVFRCTECGAWDPPWQDVKMEGTVFSWIRTFQNFGLDYLPPPFVSVLVALDGVYRRPTEVDLLLGDPAKALKQLGWRHRTTFQQLVAEMVEADRMVIKKMGDRYVQPVLHAAQ